MDNGQWTITAAFPVTRIASKIVHCPLSIVHYNRRMPTYRLLKDADVSGKRVLVRVDHNIETDLNGVLKNDEKIRATLPTIEYLLKKGAHVILMTHVGRPKGKRDAKFSTIIVAIQLQKLLPHVHVQHLTKTVGPEVESAVRAQTPGTIVYLENVRFQKEEEGTPGEQAVFGKRLAALADVYINEAFASCHEYEEASTCAVARLLPSYMGKHFEKEAAVLGTVLDDPRRPLVLIMSGSKMETKIPVIRYFLDKGDDILLGGCIANTFIAARGFDVGTSKYEEEFIPLAQELMLEAEKTEKADIHVPRDAVLAGKPDDMAQRIDLPVEDIEGDMGIFDVGAVTVERYCRAIEKAGMIVWNGPLGMYEIEQFAGATRKLAEAIAQATAKGTVSIIGGGDTLDFHVRYGLPLDVYTFVSTGGGAMLEFISGTRLPAIDILTQR